MRFSLSNPAIAALFLVVSFWSAPAAADGWRQLALAGLDGKSRPLADFIGRGQWVVVNIWGPKCPPCVEEMPELGSFHDEHAGHGAMVLGIALDFPSFGYAKKDEVETFLDEYLIDFPVLLADHTVYRDLTGRAQLKAVPTTLLYDREGQLVGEHVGTLTQAGLESYLKQRDPDMKARLE